MHSPYTLEFGLVSSDSPWNESIRELAHIEVQQHADTADNDDADYDDACCGRTVRAIQIIYRSFKST